MTDSFRPIRKEAEQPVTEEVEELNLSLADQIKFAEGILNPPETTEALRQAFELRKRLICARIN